MRDVALQSMLRWHLYDISAPSDNALGLLGLRIGVRRGGLGRADIGLTNGPQLEMHTNIVGSVAFQSRWLKSTCTIETGLTSQADDQTAQHSHLHRSTCPGC